MTSTLSARQGALTRAINRLFSHLNNSEDLINTQVQLPFEESDRKKYLSALQLRVRQTIIAFQTDINAVQIKLDNYNAAADQIDPNIPAIEELNKTVKTNTEKTLDLINTATSQLTKLLQLRDTLESAKINDEEVTVVPPVAKLPPIPIPKFNGELWEWETFWGAFNHSVHSRNIDEYLKMNYLLDSLEGKAKAFVKQYEIARESYSMVINHLKNKYANKQALVHEMLNRLHKAQATSARLEDQETLCESLFSITSQLYHKGEHVDSMYLQ